MACQAPSSLRYAPPRPQVEPIDDIYFNSGLLLLSRSLPGADDLHKPESIETLLGDQAWFNAMRHKYRWPIADFGYHFNFMGSFEGLNAERRPLVNTTDAYVIHATTGLPGGGSPEGRLSYLNGIHESWLVKGL